MKRFVTTGLVLVLLAGLAHAAAIITIEQDGDDVLATLSGTINTAGLTFTVNEYLGTPTVDASNAYVSVGSGSAMGGELPVKSYIGLTGPDAFGSGTSVMSSGGTGDALSITGDGDVMQLPFDYVSGSELNATALWESTTISTLGLTPGSYVWNFGSGGDADTLTVTVTPEPATMGLLGVGGAFLLLRRRRRR